MPLAKRLRRSPGYLYLKLYALSLTVSLFAARPISRHLTPAHLEQLRRLHDLLPQQWHTHLPAHLRDLKERQFPSIGLPKREGSSSKSALETKVAATKRTRKPTQFSFALKSLAPDAPSWASLPDANTTLQKLAKLTRRVGKLPRRWYERAKDLREVRGRMESDERDTRRWPELKWDAEVRLSKEAHPLEVAFVKQRRERIAESKALHAFLQLPPDVHVHPDDVPLLAIGGSGGGYRAKYGFTAGLSVLKEAGAWDCTTWVAGVSGSNWTLAALYTIASQSPDALLEHYTATAHEGVHPLSRQALDIVARSKRGVYFLIAPLLAKARTGVVGLGLIDLYATMTTSYQFLSRNPQARPRLSRSTFQWHRVWSRANLTTASAPLPLLTAVRRSPTCTTSYEFWEISPLEIGSSTQGAYVPSWSFGRPFFNGKSTTRTPEISLALLLGYCTSAPAGPLSGYIGALLASLPEETWARKALGWLNAFVGRRRFERMWGNPIRAPDEPNPLRGVGKMGGKEGDEEEGAVMWEKNKRIRLMDAGLGNNLPSHVFATHSRRADVILALDYSSDVQTGAAISRLHAFAAERSLILKPRIEYAPLEKHERKPRSAVEAELNEVQVDEKEAEREGMSAEDVREKFEGRYAQILDAWRTDVASSGLATSTHGVEMEKRGGQGEPDMRLIYCPLLPHSSEPSFDPANSSFSNSYNLVWKPEQVSLLARTTKASVTEHVIPSLRLAMREAWEAKRRRRLGLSTPTST